MGVGDWLRPTAAGARNQHGLCAPRSFLPASCSSSGPSSGFSSSSSCPSFDRERPQRNGGQLSWLKYTKVYQVDRRGAHRGAQWAPQGPPSGAHGPGRGHIGTHGPHRGHLGVHNGLISHMGPHGSFWAANGPHRPILAHIGPCATCQRWAFVFITSC